MAVVANPKGLVLAVQGGGNPVGSLPEFCGGELTAVANKPLLVYALEALQGAGVREVAIVVTPLVEAQVRVTVDNASVAGLQIRYLAHPSPPGLVGALISAERFLDGRPCVAHLGHGMLRQPLQPLVTEFARDNLDALLLLEDRASPPEFQERRLVKLMKPAGKASANVGPGGVHVLGPHFLRQLGRGAPTGWPGVIEALAALLSSGGRARGQIADGWCRVGDPDELLVANRLVLDDLQPDYADAQLRDTTVQGRVVIDPSAQVEASIVRGPTIIGAGARIRHAYIGPYTTVGENVVIEGAELEYSIVLSAAEIKHLGPRLEASVIGQGARVFRDFGLPRAMRLRVGQGVEISLA